MSAVIFLSVMYIGSKPVKVETYFLKGCRFIPFIPQPVEVAVAQEMAADNPEVYMITSDDRGIPTVDYIAFLVSNGRRSLAEKVVSDAKLDKSVDDFLEEHGYLSDLIESAEPNVPTSNVEKQLEEEQQKKLDGYIQFKQKVDKAVSKPALVKLAKSELDYDLADATRAEQEATLLEQYRIKRGIE